MHHQPDFDGPRNLLNAIRIATTPEARGKGVMLAMNDRINAARSVTKTHTSGVETFKSGDFGFLGEVWDDKVVFTRAPLRRQRIDIGTAEMPRVEILAMFGGADGSLMRYAVDQGAKGIVVQAVGMGNMNVSMFEAVKYALSGTFGGDRDPRAQWPHDAGLWFSSAAARPPTRPVRSDGRRSEPSEGAPASHAVCCNAASAARRKIQAAFDR